MSKGEKKKDSTLSVISCILAGAAFILPLPSELSGKHESHSVGE